MLLRTVRIISRLPTAALLAGGAAAILLILVALQGGADSGAPLAEANADSPRGNAPSDVRFLSGSDVLKDPSAANLFIGGGPLLIDEVVTNVPAEGLGAFDLHITYDASAVLVWVQEGPFLGSTGRSTSCSTIWNAGDLRFSCTSIGLQTGPTGTGVLATLIVYPHFDLSLRPNKNNGIKIELDDVWNNTKLFGTPGKPLTLRKAGDAKIIVRALEGDLNRDCVVDIVDYDLIRARLGAQKGSLKYISFYDLQPAKKGDGDIDVQDVQFVGGRIGSTCASPHPGQASPTPRATKTAKPTSTITATPTVTPEGPRFRKLPKLSNLFLTRQGDKIPPVQCLGPEGGDDTAELIETLSAPVLTNSQHIGGFEFTLNYDSVKICVELRPGGAADGMVCTIEDSVTAPAVQGVAHMRCVAKSKDVTGPSTKEEEGRQLAIIIVHPQPELYSQLKGDQNNGVVAQILNKGCKLMDLQGNLIPPYSCEDADITIRFLEGDVEPDCIVDGRDTQLVAFHWGAEKGSLLYVERLDVSPPNQDGRIDVNDLQHVYGRFGSTCENPHPPQPPQNPKA